MKHRKYVITVYNLYDNSFVGYLKAVTNGGLDVSLTSNPDYAKKFNLVGLVYREFELLNKSKYSYNYEEYRG